MTGPRSSLRPQRPRLGLDRNHSTGPPLTQINGRSNGNNIRPAKRLRAEQPVIAKQDSDPSDTDIFGSPKSSDDEAGNVTTHDSDDSDERYRRTKGGDIPATTFGDKTSKPRVQLAHRKQSHESRPDSHVTLSESQRDADLQDPKEPDELDTLREKRKKPSKLATYGDKSKHKGKSSSRSGFFTPKAIEPDHAQSSSGRSSFHQPSSLSPLRSQSPKKMFKSHSQDLDLDFNELEESKRSPKRLPGRNSSPFAAQGKRRMSPVDDTADNKNGKATDLTISHLRGGVQRKNSKRNRLPPDPTPDEASQRPIFKIPGLDDDDLFDDSSSLGATTVPGESEDTSWDHLEIEEPQATSLPRCPMCHQEVDRELLEKYSKQGKMSVKQQTTFCRSHKRKSAAKLGTEKGYPDISWEDLDRRLRSHRKFLQDILEGTRASHYRSILRERVDSGKNRTLLKSHANLTPGYYGPKGLQVMTQFIMRTLSDVLRRRAVEDKLISARSYTGYVQTVLVPELAVRLIMEDMSVDEESARDVLKESVEIGELLHEEDRDIVMINESEGDTAPEM